MDNFANKRCTPCAGGLPPLNNEQAQSWLASIPGWSLDKGGKAIYRAFSFKDFYQTMAFVNALAWIAHREDHHPNLEVGYNRCVVCYSTHAIGGLSENDYICAAAINQMNFENV